MRNLLRIILGLVFVVSLSGVAFADFSDVSESDINFNAIDYLEEQGIVGGYPDGTFKPNRTLNRAELTKIVVESLGAQLSESEGCFPDMEEGSWYARYVCTAQELGLVEGYPDGTFKPAQTINRAEAVKIIMEAEALGESDQASYSDISGGEWFSGYVGRAYELNYLPFLNEFVAGELVLRRDFSEIYYRALVARDLPNRVYEAKIELGEPYYPDIVLEEVELSQRVPRYVLENEVYVFEGNVLEDDAVLQILNASGDNQTDLGDAGDEFSVPLWFGSKGVYQVEIGGKSFDIQAIGDWDEVGEIDSVEGEFYVSTFKNDIVFNQQDVRSYLKRYTFSLGYKELTFLNRQDFRQITLPNFWLKDFWDGESDILLDVDVADFDVEEGSRSSFYDLDVIDLEVVPEFEVILNNIDGESLDFSYGVGDRINVRFEALIPSEKYLYVIDEGGEVKILEDYVVVNNDNVRLDYTPPEDSLYEIIEVNDVEGRALINYPIYRHNVLPIGDDPYDRSDLNLEPTVQNALDLLNEDRVAFGLDEVVLSGSLNLLAQAHADDMAENKYVSHSDLEGRKVSERKVEYGIKTFVGENIARNFEISDAQSSLMRSAAHRVNILDPNWTEVGIGIAVDGSGALYLVQNFSFDSNIVIEEFEELIEEQLGVGQHPDLVEITDDWSDWMVENQDYGTNVAGRSLMDEVGDLNTFVSGNAVTGISTFIQEVEDLIYQSVRELEDEGYDYYGFDVKLGDDGLFYFVLVITS